MRILAVSYPPQPKDKKKIEHFVACYDKFVRPGVELENTKLKLREPDLKEQGNRTASWCTEFTCLLRRNMIGVRRDPMQSNFKIGQNVIFAVLQLVVFTDVGFQNGDDLKTKIDISNNDKSNPAKYRIYYGQLFSLAMQTYSATYFVAVNTFMADIMNTILVFQGERPVFLREQANKMYGVAPYFMAKTLTDIPIIILTPLITTILLYFALNLSYSVE